MDYLTWSLIMAGELIIMYVIAKHYQLRLLEEERYKLNALNNKEITSEIISIKGDLAQHILFGQHKKK